MFCRFGTPGHNEAWLKADASARNASTVGKRHASRDGVKAKRKQDAIGGGGNGGGDNKRRKSDKSFTSSVTPAPFGSEADFIVGSSDLDAIDSPSKARMTDMENLVTGMRTSLDSHNAMVQQMMDRLAMAEERKAKATEAKVHAKQNSVRIEALQAILRVAPRGSDEYKEAIAALTTLASL